MTYYSTNQSEHTWCKLNAKSLLGAKRECTKDYDFASEIEIAVVDEHLPDVLQQYEVVAVRKPYETKWINLN